jgi:hypothetical protein
MGTPPPTDSGDIGDATVLVAMGNDTADKTLSQLQGTTPPPSTGDDSDTDVSTVDTSESTTDVSGTDAPTGESSATGDA